MCEDDAFWVGGSEGNGGCRDSGGEGDRWSLFSKVLVPDETTLLNVPVCAASSRARAEAVAAVAAVAAGGARAGAGARGLEVGSSSRSLSPPSDDARWEKMTLLETTGGGWPPGLGWWCVGVGAWGLGFRAKGALNPTASSEPSRSTLDCEREPHGLLVASGPATAPSSEA